MKMTLSTFVRAMALSSLVTLSGYNGHSVNARVHRVHKGVTSYSIPTLVFPDGTTLPLIFNKDYPVIYYGKTWRVVMLDTNTCALLFMKQTVDPTDSLIDSKWKILNTEHHHLCAWMAWARFDLYGDGAFSFVPVTRNPTDTQEIIFQGDADILVTRSVRINTPNTLINTVGPDPSTNRGAFISIKDYPADDTPGIAAPVNQIHYWGKNSHIPLEVSKSLGKELNGRVERYSKLDLDSSSFAMSKMTAPQFLSEVKAWYGLRDFFLDPRIDTTENGALLCGSLPKGICFETLLEILECDLFHYEFVNNELYVIPLKKYLQIHNNRHKKGSSGCG